MKMYKKPKGSYSNTAAARASAGLAGLSGKMWPKMGSVMPKAGLKKKK